MIRITYALWQGFKHKSCIQDKKKNAIHALDQITPEGLAKKKVKVLALDFDGVLSPHGASEPTSRAHAWLTQLCQHWSASNIVILSNKPQKKRIHFFKHHYPEIDFIISPRKKPYPDGLHQIAQKKQVATQQILLVDDRLLTGMLACCLSGAQGAYLSRPLKKFSSRPIAESFFATLRALERLMF